MAELCDILHLHVLVNAVLISVINCLTPGKFSVLFKKVLHCEYHLGSPKHRKISCA